MEATQLQFTWVNPLSGEYAIVTLPEVCGTLEENNVDHRMLAYNRLAKVIGVENTEYCTITAFKQFVR